MIRTLVWVKIKPAFTGRLFRSFDYSLDPVNGDHALFCYSAAGDGEGYIYIYRLADGALYRIVNGNHQSPYSVGQEISFGRDGINRPQLLSTIVSNDTKITDAIKKYVEDGL